MKINVIPSAEFKAIAGACIDAFQMKEKTNSWKWNIDRTTYFQMLPSEDLYIEFDYIAFQLQQMDDTGGVRGKIIFNLQEKSFKDYFKALFMMDRIEKKFDLPREQIFQEDGSVNVKSIQSIVEPMLREITAARSEYAEKKPSVTGAKATEIYSNKGSRSVSTVKPAKPNKAFDPKNLDA
jgi:hypothetical protein